MEGLLIPTPRPLVKNPRLLDLFDGDPVESVLQVKVLLLKPLQSFWKTSRPLVPSILKLRRI